MSADSPGALTARLRGLQPPATAKLTCSSSDLKPLIVTRRLLFPFSRSLNALLLLLAAESLQLALIVSETEDEEDDEDDDDVKDDDDDDDEDDDEEMQNKGQRLLLLSRAPESLLVWRR